MGSPKLWTLRILECLAFKTLRMYAPGHSRIGELGLGTKIGTHHFWLLLSHFSDENAGARREKSLLQSHTRRQGPSPWNKAEEN